MSKAQTVVLRRLRNKKGHNRMVTTRVCQCDNGRRSRLLGAVNALLGPLTGRLLVRRVNVFGKTQDWWIGRTLDFRGKKD